MHDNLIMLFLEQEYLKNYLFHLTLGNIPRKLEKRIERCQIKFYMKE